MNSDDKTLTSRRQFLKATGGLAAVSALTGAKVPAVHAASSEEIQVALVGCGGRGSGAAMNALTTAKSGPIKLVAMADAYADRLERSHRGLSRAGGTRIAVPEDRRLVGFDSYKKAMDSLRPGDVVIL